MLNNLVKMVDKFEAMKQKMASMRSTKTISVPAAKDKDKEKELAGTKESKPSTLSSFMKKTGFGTSKDKEATTAPSTSADASAKPATTPPAAELAPTTTTESTAAPASSGEEGSKSLSLDIKKVKSSGGSQLSPKKSVSIASPRKSPRAKKVSVADLVTSKYQQKMDQEDGGAGAVTGTGAGAPAEGEGLSKNLAANSRSKSFNELQKMQLKVGEMRAQKRSTKKPTGDAAAAGGIEALGFRKSSRAPPPDPNVVGGQVSYASARRGSRLVKPEAQLTTGGVGGKQALSAAAAKLEEMKAKTAARKQRQEERQKKKEENKQAVNNQTEIFMKTLLNLESQFKQHESIRNKLNKELDDARSENDVLRASLQAIQSHLQKLKGDVDSWVSSSATVSGGTLVSLQSLLGGLISNPQDMPLIVLPKPEASSSSSSAPPSETSSPADSPSVARAPPPPPPPPGVGLPIPPPPPKAPRPGSVKIESTPTFSKRGSTQLGTASGAGGMSFLDSIKSGTSLKKLDPKEIQREKERQARESTATGLAATLQETMRIAMELRKKAMETQDSDDEDDDDEEDEDSEDDDGWYSDEE